MIRQAMVLAAGLGLRMRPLTTGTAKPLLPLAGRSLLDHALDRLTEAGVERIVVNAHWQASQVLDHLHGRPGIVVRNEDALLETGGAVHAALRAGVLRDEPFYVVNGDAYWLDGPTPALDRLRGALGSAEGGADAVLLVHRTFQVHAEIGAGDFALDPWGLPRRRREREIVPYVYTGVQLATPALFSPAPAGAPTGAFSLNPLWDHAIESGRLRAVVHDGLWFHLSRPADLEEAEAALRAGSVGETR